VRRNLAAGAAVGSLAALTTLLAYFTLYFLLRDVEATRETTRVLLASIMFAAPLFICAGASLLGMSVITSRLSAGIIATSVIAGVFIGFAFVVLAPLASAVNDCEFDVSLPLWWYGGACD
jgi:hypothetical protein